MLDVFATFTRSARWLVRALALLALVTRPAFAQTPANPAPPTNEAAPAGAPKPAPGANAPAEATAAEPAQPIPPSEAEAAAGLTIERIIVAGTRRLTQEDVLTYLREHAGEPFSPEKLTQDVKELYNSGFFEDVEVDLSRHEEKVILRFLVRERATVQGVLFVGNHEIDSDDLTEEIELKPNTVFSPAAVLRSIQKIRDMYAEKGYFLADVTSELIPRKENEVTIQFKIVEHGQVTVRRITFIGNQALTDEELRQVMFTGSTTLFDFGSGAKFRQDAFERDMSVIAALYYDRGYLSVNMSTPRIMLTPDKNGIEVSITIDEGPRYRIRQLRVYEAGPNGEEVEPIGGRRNLRLMVRAQPGDYFNRAALMEDLVAIKTLYEDHGYARVEASPQPNLDPKRHEVDVIVKIVRGPLVYFERIEVRGNDKTRDKVIRREMEVREGEKFNHTNLERSKARITALGYFERVEYSTEQGSAPDKMNVYVEVTERPTGTFQLGAGFSSVENFIVTAQVQQANLFGNGQSLSLQAQVSGLRQEVNLTLFEPYFLDSKFDASISLYDQSRFYTDFSQSSRGGDLTFGYPLVEPQLTASLTYKLTLERVSTQPQTTIFGTSSSVSVFRQLPLANLFNDGITSSLRPALTYDTRDNRLFPTKGIFARVSSEWASPTIGSHNDFLRHSLTGRFFYPLGSGFVLKFNSETGLVTSPTKDGVPIFERFFLGGIYTLRGFAFNSIGPRMPLTRITDPNSPPIPNGANIGGNLQYLQNLELEFSILEAVGLRGVIFTDAGNTWNLEQNYCDTGGASARFRATNPCFDGFRSLTSLRTSWGFGIRWFSPLGPLRFEWGFPFSPLPYEESSDFEFTIGNFF